MRTPSDFGMNGDRPSHPELLDWLATQFVEKKWSIKAMHKLMLMSNAYQQSTGIPEAKKFCGDRSEQSSAVADELAAPGIGSSARFGPGAERAAEQKRMAGRACFSNIPADVAEGFEFFKWFPSDEKDQLRRTIYTFQRRSRGDDR